MTGPRRGYTSWARSRGCSSPRSCSAPWAERRARWAEPCARSSTTTRRSSALRPTRTRAACHAVSSVGTAFEPDDVLGRRARGGRAGDRLRRALRARLVGALVADAGTIPRRASGRLHGGPREHHDRGQLTPRCARPSVFTGAHDPACPPDDCRAAAAVDGGPRRSDAARAADADPARGGPRPGLTGHPPADGGARRSTRELGALRRRLLDLAHPCALRPR